MTIQSALHDRCFAGGKKARRVMVVGSGPLAEATAAVLVERRARTTRPDAGAGAEVILLRAGRDASTDGLTHVQRIDIAKPDEAAELVASLLRRVPLRLLKADRRIGESLMRHRPRTKYCIAKRSLDIAGALLLGLVALPLFPVIAVAIRLDSTGPVFYRQTRVGLDGKYFCIWKFRTMQRDAEVRGAVYAAVNDPRITRVGAFLRRTRIDEVPQVWNILKGEMSLIGPRPERPENVAMLEEHLPGFKLRTLMRPGLTGWAQVCYPYAGTIEQTGNKLEYDLYYVTNASLSFDLEILTRTLRVVLGLRGQ